MSATPRIVVAGAGVAGLETVLSLRRLLEHRAQIALIAPETEFTYRPLSVAETFGLGEVYRFELSRFAHDLKVELVCDELVRVEAERGEAHLRSGAVRGYEALVVACGARSVEALAGALTFRGEQDEEAMRSLLSELREGVVDSVGFVLSSGAAWPMALYELVLLAVDHLGEQAAERTLTIVTYEAAPLEQFGRAASDAVGELLAERGIRLVTDRYAVQIEGDCLRLVPEGELRADRFVALPLLRGPAIPGLPLDGDGFVLVDDRARVPGVDDVFAIGDATAFPIKQGGIAAQQADVAAETIAAGLGEPIVPEPFRPVLRGLLLTGEVPRFLRAEITGGHGETSRIAAHPLWWPPSKICGRLLAPYIAEQAALPVPQVGEADGTVQVDVEFGLEDAGGRDCGDGPQTT